MVDFGGFYRQMKSLLSGLFKRRSGVRIGLYGPPNGGKTTLANRICMDWLGEELGRVSPIPHETREIQMKENVKIEVNGKKLEFSLVDTPGIATKIDYEEFVKKGLKRKEAKQRAKEATKGVIESIKWLDKMDLVIVVLDSTEDPVNQVNITILGNLEARKIPVIVVANKIDMKRANIERVKASFPNYRIIGISAKRGDNVQKLYETLFEVL